MARPGVKTVVITGVSRGLGRAMALGFAEVGFIADGNERKRFDALEIVVGNSFDGHGSFTPVGHW